MRKRITFLPHLLEFFSFRFRQIKVYQTIYSSQNDKIKLIISNFIMIHFIIRRLAYHSVNILTNSFNLIKKHIVICIYGITETFGHLDELFYFPCIWVCILSGILVLINNAKSLLLLRDYFSLFFSQISLIISRKNLLLSFLIIL